jgi:hypothetical protein
VVLDRDFMTVPVADIKDIHPTLTMVGGRVVFSLVLQSSGSGGTVVARRPEPQLRVGESPWNYFVRPV